MLREDAYRLVQGHAMRAWKDDLVFRDEVAKDAGDHEAAFARRSWRRPSITRGSLGNVDAIFKRVLGE